MKPPDPTGNISFRAASLEDRIRQLLGPRVFPGAPARTGEGPLVMSQAVFARDYLSTADAQDREIIRKGFFRA